MRMRYGVQRQEMAQARVQERRRKVRRSDGIWIWNIEGVDVWLGMKRERGGERTRDYVNQVTGYGGQGDRGDRGTGDGRQQTADGGRGN